MQCDSGYCCAVFLLLEIKYLYLLRERELNYRGKRDGQLCDLKMQTHIKKIINILILCQGATQLQEVSLNSTCRFNFYLMNL